MIQYYAEIETEHGSESTPITARSDAGAIRNVKRIALRHPAARVYLGWRRDSDGCRGYINPVVGASPTGEPW